MIYLHLEPLAEGYVATSPDVPGLVAKGRNVAEAVEIAHGLAHEIVESCINQTCWASRVGKPRLR